MRKEKSFPRTEKAVIQEAPQTFCPLTQQKCRADCMWWIDHKCALAVAATELFVLADCLIRRYPPPDEG